MLNCLQALINVHVTLRCCLDSASDDQVHLLLHNRHVQYSTHCITLIISVTQFIAAVAWSCHIGLIQVRLPSKLYGFVRKGIWN